MQFCSVCFRNILLSPFMVTTVIARSTYCCSRTFRLLKIHKLCPLMTLRFEEYKKIVNFFQRSISIVRFFYFWGFRLGNEQNPMRVIISKARHPVPLLSLSSFLSSFDHLTIFLFPLWPSHFSPLFWISKFSITARWKADFKCIWPIKLTNVFSTALRLIWELKGLKLTNLPVVVIATEDHCVILVIRVQNVVISVGFSCWENKTMFRRRRILKVI